MMLRNMGFHWNLEKSKLVLLRNGNNQRNGLILEQDHVILEIGKPESFLLIKAINVAMKLATLKGIRQKLSEAGGLHNFQRRGGEMLQYSLLKSHSRSSYSTIIGIINLLCVKVLILLDQTLCCCMTSTCRGNKPYQHFLYVV